VVLYSIAGRILAAPAMFYRRLLTAYSGDHVVVAKTEALEIEMYDLDVNPRKIARLPSSPVAVTAEDRQPYLNQRSAATVAAVEATGTRTTHPSLAGMLVDGDGNIWLQRFVRSPATEMTPYSVVDREGRWITDVVFPPGFRVMEIERNHVLGLVRDSLGVEYVVRHRLQRVH
jgi:hypothetical protein